MKDNLKKYKPITPGQRQLILVNKSSLHKGRPFKPLTVPLKSSGGRNNQGRITIRARGGGHKQRYRLIDFKRNKFDVEAKVDRIEYDPNRSAFIALITYKDGEKSYILAPNKLKVGDSIISTTDREKVDIRVGNCLPLSEIPIGSFIHNIELKAKKGGQIARSAGAYAQIIGRDQDYSQIKLMSGETRRIPGNCLASLGVVSNLDHNNQSFGKAGRKRWLGIKPTVRGVAKNPVDHPHGGGEGKTAGGRNPVTPWGKPTKGYKTRRSKKVNKNIIKRRK